MGDRTVQGQLAAQIGDQRAKAEPPHDAPGLFPVRFHHLPKLQRGGTARTVQIKQVAAGPGSIGKPQIGAAAAGQCFLDPLPPGQKSRHIRRARHVRHEACNPFRLQQSVIRRGHQKRCAQLLEGDRHAPARSSLRRDDGQAQRDSQICDGARLGRYGNPVEPRLAQGTGNPRQHRHAVDLDQRFVRYPGGGGQRVRTRARSGQDQGLGHGRHPIPLVPAILSVPAATPDPP